MSKLEVEYGNYLRTLAMKKYIRDSLSSGGLQYEALNCLEKWLIYMANAPGLGVFSKAEPNDPGLGFFSSELKSKKVPHPEEIVKVCYTLSVTKKTWEGKIPFLVRAFIPQARINLLLSRGASIDDIELMMFRYLSLSPRAQQWSIPLPVFELLVKKYQLKVEGFASPINSQIITVDPSLKFCSIYLDTDAIFGSLGSFFDQSFDNTCVIANPPFVLKIMDDMAEKIVRDLGFADRLQFFVAVPAWTDSHYFKVFMASAYTKLSLRLSYNNYYYCKNNGMIRPRFESYIFVLSTGYEGVDYRSLEDDILRMYADGLRHRRR